MNDDKDVEKDGGIQYVVNIEFTNEKIEIKIILVNFVLDYNEFKKEKYNGRIDSKNDQMLLTLLSKVIS